MDDTTLSNLITGGAAALLRAQRLGLLLDLARPPRRVGATGGDVSHPRRRDSLARRWQSITLQPSRANYPGLITFRLTMEGLYAVRRSSSVSGTTRCWCRGATSRFWPSTPTRPTRLYDLKFARLPQVRARINVAAAQLVRRAADNSQYFAEQNGQKLLPGPTTKPQARTMRRQSVA